MQGEVAQTFANTSFALCVCAGAGKLHATERNRILTLPDDLFIAGGGEKTTSFILMLPSGDYFVGGFLSFVSQL